MTPENIVADNKRIAKNRLDALLLLFMIAPLRAQALPVTNNVNAPIERVYEENEAIFEIALCNTSDSESEPEKESCSSSFFAEGFTPTPNRGRNGRNEISNERTTELFAGKKKRERQTADTIMNAQEFKNSKMPIDWAVFENRNSKLADEACKALLRGDNMAQTTRLINEYLKGNENPGIGSEHFKSGVSYLRHRRGGRVFYKLKTKDAVVYMKIMGISDKDNEDQVMRAMEREYDL